MPPEPESLEKEPRSRQPPAAPKPKPVEERSATPSVQSATGNLAVQRLTSLRIQRKQRSGPSADPYEQQADHVAKRAVAVLHGAAVEPERPLLDTGTVGPRIQRQVAEEAPAAPAAPAGPSAPAAAPAAAAAPAGGLIVDDKTADLTAGQMKKSDFLAQLRAAASGAVQDALRGTSFAPVAGIGTDHWIRSYAGQSAAQLERTIHASVPGAARAATASGYIAPITSKVASAVAEFARTGAVPAGVPFLPDLPGGDGVLATAANAVADVAGAAVSVVSDVARILFKEGDGAAPAGADPHAVQRQLGTGDALEGGVRSRMSSVFGYDFSAVRVHTGEKAASLSANLNARAFTIGSDIAFGAGEFQPGTPAGEALIAHELAHVVQQGGAAGAHGPLPKAEEGTGSLEQDADAAAVSAVVSLWDGAKTATADIAQNAMPRLKSGLRLQSCKKAPTPKPSERFNLPARTDLTSAPGEQILFSAIFESPKPLDFETSYKAAGGHFTIAGTGPLTSQAPGCAVKNLPFYIDSGWDGTTPITVEMQMKRLSDGEVVAQKNWTFKNKAYFPTTIWQFEGEDEKPIGIGQYLDFAYIVGPDVGGDGKPRSYDGQTVLERFEGLTCNISRSELTPAFQAEHPDLGTPDKIAAYFFDPSAFNATFVVDKSNSFLDQNGENNVNQARPGLASALTTMKDVYFDITQVFEAKPNVALGRYVIRRGVRANGGLSLKKFRQ